MSGTLLLPSLHFKSRSTSTYVPGESTKFSRINLEYTYHITAVESTKFNTRCRFRSKFGYNVPVGQRKIVDIETVSFQ